MELIWSGSEVPRNMGMTRLTSQGYHFRRLPWIRPSPRDRQGPRQSISPSRWMSTQRHAGVDRIEPVPAQVGKWIPAAARPRMSGSGAGMTNETRAQQPVIPVEAGIQKKAWLVKRIIPRNIAFPAVLYSVVTWTVYPLGLAGSWDGSSGLQGAGSRRSQPIPHAGSW